MEVGGRSVGRSVSRSDDTEATGQSSTKLYLFSELCVSAADRGRRKQYACNPNYIVLCHYRRAHACSNIMFYSTV